MDTNRRKWLAAARCPTQPTASPNSGFREPCEPNAIPIEGAVHAHFGDYGPQPGDGEPEVDRDVAQRRIVEATLDFLAGMTPGR